MLFLVGGNGSGKTTFMKLLTALSARGRDELNRRIGDAKRQPIGISSRRFFRFNLSTNCTVFGIRPAAYNELLRLMEIANNHVSRRPLLEHQPVDGATKTPRPGRYLEDKPIYVFDEVAADQGLPHFRTYFYEVMLADLPEERARR